MKNLLLIVLILLASCLNSNNKSAINGEQIKKPLNKLTLVDLRVIKENNIYVDSSTCIKVFFLNSKYKIIRGYVDCLADSLRHIDSTNRVIDGCNKKINMDKDTIKIFLTPELKGTNKFPIITLLFKDSTNNILYMHDTTFTLDVKQH